jgi:hypothetical protein
MSTLIVNIDNDIDKELIVKHISMLKGINNVALIGDWNNWSDDDETNYLCSIPGMKKQLIEGMNTPLEDCISIEEVLPDWHKMKFEEK